VSSFRKRILSATAVALSVGLLATGCSNLAPSTEAAADGTVVVVVPELSTQLSFDTSYAITASYFDTSLALNATLIRKPYIDSDQAGTTEQDLYNFEGVLAEDYTVSEDGLTYTFTLREGVRWATNSPAKTSSGRTSASSTPPPASCPT
jgi:peptide/nickel transport system substrate-binding protein